MINMLREAKLRLYYINLQLKKTHNNLSSLLFANLKTNTFGLSEVQSEGNQQQCLMYFPLHTIGLYKITNKYFSSLSF